MEEVKRYLAECCADCPYDESEIELTREQLFDLHQVGHGYCPQCGREVRFTLIKEEEKKE